LGLVGGLVFGLVVGLVFGLIFGLIFGLGGVLIGGLVVGLVLGLVYGGNVCIQHVTVRLFLWRDGYIPLNYVRFLNEAADRILLTRVGGSYKFYHRMLQDYFEHPLDGSSGGQEASSSLS
jgi:hypothetical protein